MGGAEEGAEARAACSEFLLWRHRHINFEAAGQEENSVDARAGAQVPMVKSAEFAVEDLGPIIKDSFGASAIGDPEGDVNIGPFVLGTDRCGAGERTRCDPWVVLRQIQDAITDRKS